MSLVGKDGILDLHWSVSTIESLRFRLSENRYLSWLCCNRQLLKITMENCATFISNRTKLKLYKSLLLFSDDTHLVSLDTTNNSVTKIDILERKSFASYISCLETYTNVYVGTSDGQLHVLNPELVTLRSVAVHTCKVVSVVETCRTVFTLAEDGRLFSWDADSFVFKNGSSPSLFITALFPVDRTTLVAQEKDGSLYLWDSTVGLTRGKLPEGSKSVKKIRSNFSFVDKRWVRWHEQVEVFQGTALQNRVQNKGLNTLKQVFSFCPLVVVHTKPKSLSVCRPNLEEAEFDRVFKTVKSVYFKRKVVSFEVLADSPRTFSSSAAQKLRTFVLFVHTEGNRLYKFRVASEGASVEKLCAWGKDFPSQPPKGVVQSARDLFVFSDNELFSYRFDTDRLAFVSKHKFAAKLTAVVAAPDSLLVATETGAVLSVGDFVEPFVQVSGSVVSLQKTETLLFVASETKVVCFEGKHLCWEKTFSQKLSQICFLPEKAWLLVADWTSVVAVYLVDGPVGPKKRPVFTFYGHSLPVVKLMPDLAANELVTVSLDKTVKVFGLSFGELKKSLVAHTDLVTDSVFLGQNLLTVGKDGKMVFWQRPLFTKVAELLVFGRNPIWGCASFADFWVVVCQDASVRVFEWGRVVSLLSEKKEPPTKGLKTATDDLVRANSSLKNKADYFARFVVSLSNHLCGKESDFEFFQKGFGEEDAFSLLGKVLDFWSVNELDTFLRFASPSLVEKLLVIVKQYFENKSDTHNLCLLFLYSKYVARTLKTPLFSNVFETTEKIKSSCLKNIVVLKHLKTLN